MIDAMNLGSYIAQFLHAGGDLYVADVDHPKYFELPVLCFEPTLYAQDPPRPGDFPTRYQLHGTVFALVRGIRPYPDDGALVRLQRIPARIGGTSFVRAV